MLFKQKRWKVILTLITFLALGVLIFAIRKQIMETIANFGRVNTMILLLMPLWTFVNYHAYTKMYQNIFGIIGNKVDYKPMLRTTIELNFVNIVFPSGGVTGVSYFGARMRSLGVRASNATLIQIIRYILLFIAIQILLLVAFIALAVEGKANSFLLFTGGSVITILAFGTLLVAYIADSKTRIRAFLGFLTRVANRAIYVFRPKHPETINISKAEQGFNELHKNYVVLKKDYKKLKRPLAWAIAVAAAEIAAIYTVYLAFGAVINPGAIVLAYAIANLAGLISVLPGGIGIYEALMTAVLVASGVPAGVSIPVTIMYRVINMTMQLSIGYYFYHKAVLQGADNA